MSRSPAHHLHTHTPTPTPPPRAPESPRPVEQGRPRPSSLPLARRWPCRAGAPAPPTTLAESSPPGAVRARRVCPPCPSHPASTRFLVHGFDAWYRPACSRSLQQAPGFEADALHADLRRRRRADGGGRPPNYGLRHRVSSPSTEIERRRGTTRTPRGEGGHGRCIACRPSPPAPDDDSDGARHCKNETACREASLLLRWRPGWSRAPRRRGPRRPKRS